MEEDDEIMAELRQIRKEMLVEAGGDMEGLFRAIKAKEAELIQQGERVVSLRLQHAKEEEPDAA